MKREAPEAIHTVTIIHELCTGCLKCVRGCPVRAMRFRNGVPVINWKLCIHCGECVKTCEAIQPLTTSFLELSKFRYVIVIPSPAFVGQFERYITAEHIFFALKSFGFNEVINLAPFCTAYMKAALFLIEDRDLPKPLISSICPVVVGLIHQRYPSLIQHLLPLLPPRQLAAKFFMDSILKKENMRKDGLGIIYITPCISKMIEIKGGNGGGYIHGAIAIKHIYNEILKKIKPSHKMEIGPCKYGFRQAVAGGLSEMIGEEKVVVVSGVKNLVKVLDDIEMGKMRRTAFVDALACSEGCIGGTLTVEDVYMARQKLLSLFQRREYERCEEEERIIETYLREKINPAEMWVFPMEKSESIERGVEFIKIKEEVMKNLPLIDCSICGAPTCESFAEDVAKEERREDDCIFNFLRKKGIEVENFLRRRSEK